MSSGRLSNDAWLAPLSRGYIRWLAPGRRNYTRCVGGAAVFDDADSAAIVRQANLVAVHQCRIPWECVRRRDPAP